MRPRLFTFTEMRATPGVYTTVDAPGMIFWSVPQFCCMTPTTETMPRPWEGDLRKANNYMYSKFSLVSPAVHSMPGMKTVEVGDVRTFQPEPPQYWQPNLDPNTVIEQPDVEA